MDKLRLVLLIVPIFLFVSCKHIPSGDKQSSNTTDIAGNPIYWSCNRLHKQFHYDYERLKTIWTQFSEPAKGCNLALNEKIAPDNGRVDVSRDDGNDALPPEEVQKILAEFNNMKKEEMLDSLDNAPSIGRGVISVDPTSTWRIDRIPLPLSKDEATEWKCEDLYRNVDQCEQSCSLARRILKDLWIYVAVFSDGRSWEYKDKRCRGMTGPETSERVIDFANCRRPCANDDNIPCTQCTYTIKESVGESQPRSVTCGSEEDARHVAELYCNERNAWKGCSLLECKETTGKEVVQEQGVDATKTKSKEKAWTMTAKVKAFANAEALGSGGGFSTTIGAAVSGTTEFSIRNTRGQPYVRRNGVLEGNEASTFRCYAKLTDLKTVESELTSKIGFKLQSSFGSVAGGVESTVNGAATELDTFADESLDIFAGGLSEEHMLAECSRWVEQWKEYDFRNHVEENVALKATMPSTWFKPEHQTWELFHSDYKILCNQTDGTGKRSQISRIYYQLKDKTLYFGFGVHWTSIVGWPDPIYPSKKSWYKIPIDKKSLPYIDGLVNKKLSDVRLARMLKDVVSPYTYDRYATGTRGHKTDEGHIYNCYAYD